VLEAEAGDRVEELEVHPKVVAVGLQGVSVPEGALLLHIHRQASQGRLDLEPPVDVAVRMGLEADGRAQSLGRRFHSSGGIRSLGPCGCQAL
jgi:hypothetical protein